MVLEVALFDITPGAEASFAADSTTGRDLLAATPGFRTWRMTQGVESPTRFVLLVEWDSVEAHQAFRDSDRFPQWRALIGPHFATPPHAEHFTDL
ncbi:MAG: Antibiotic biosynthesis monooxygenase [Frankiales bacterium]|jgi:heme-degrading monooxygenase HmoA|nr:Antibiotic biosynthesis monooxygenase [Frankiales bacterium]